MTLENLLAIQRLIEFSPTREGIRKLLNSAERNLKDADLKELSFDNRFDAAYKSIMQCAMIGLWANGYRTSTSQPGHHYTAIQALTKSMGVSREDIIVLDALRKQRNLSDYEGDSVSESALLACIDEANKLYQHTLMWIESNRKDLI